jgi:hypothetical protein
VEVPDRTAVRDAQRRSRARAAVAFVLASGSACAPGEDAPPPTLTASDTAMARFAETYVKLALAVGQHDADYVDAYYGPPEWRVEAVAQSRPLPDIQTRASALRSEVAARDPSNAEELVQLRHEYLLKQVAALEFRVRMLEGERFTFDEEAQALYDVTPPTFGPEHFDSLLAQLEPLLPGSGALSARYTRYRNAFVIPPERVDTVFRTAIAEARRRTLEHVTLPEDESFMLEYVTGKTWSGYNWYQGDASSLIQINTDLPITIDRAIDLAAHEGYPGHHVYNVLLEQSLVRDRGWLEFSVYPLFSPQSLIAEGSANFGIQVAFPGAQRVAFERAVLFPLAGLDSTQAERYAGVQQLVDQLSHAGNEAARQYLDGAISADSAATLLERYALMPRDRAEQRVRFMDQYRSYVINYNLGQDLVCRWVEANGGTADDPARRWEVFASLLSSPRLPSGLE